jgi:hypothetical protein
MNAKKISSTMIAITNTINVHHTNSIPLFPRGKGFVICNLWIFLYWSYSEFDTLRLPSHSNHYQLFRSKR